MTDYGVVTINRVPRPYRDVPVHVTVTGSGVDIEFADQEATTTMFDRVLACYEQAGRMAGIPYVFGGAHGVTNFRDEAVWQHGVDCSSGASIPLSAGGILAVPRALFALSTTDFEQYGRPGPGVWLTVWVHDDPTESGLHHCALDFHGSAAFTHRWWQAANEKDGVGWIGFDPTGFTARHWPGT